MAIESKTVKVWAGFVMFWGLLMTVAQLGMMTVTSGMVNAIVLFMLAGTLMVEHFSSKGFSVKNEADIVLVLLALFGILIGMASMALVELPTAIANATATIYFLLTIAVGVALVR